MRPTAHELYSAILASAKAQRATAPKSWINRGPLDPDHRQSDDMGIGVEASDALIDLIARNAAQSIAPMIQQPPIAAELDEDRCDFGDPQCGRTATHAVAHEDFDGLRRMCETHAKHVEDVYGAKIDRVIPTWDGEMRERTPRRLRWHLTCGGTLRARVIATLRHGGGGVEDVIVAFYSASVDLDGPEPGYATNHTIAEACRFAAAMHNLIGDMKADHARDSREPIPVAEVDTFQIPAGRVDVTGIDALRLVASYFLDQDIGDNGIDLVESARFHLGGARGAP